MNVINSEDYYDLIDLDKLNEEFERSEYRDMKSFQLDRIKKSFPDLYNFLIKIENDLKNLKKSILENQSQIYSINQNIKYLTNLEQKLNNELNEYIPRLCYCRAKYTFNGECGNMDCW